MGLYAHQIFPRLMECVMAGEEFRRLRRELLASVRGEVLELGIGTPSPRFTLWIRWIPFLTSLPSAAPPCLSLASFSMSRPRDSRLPTNSLIRL
jgi:hypothetical protein